MRSQRRNNRNVFSRVGQVIPGRSVFNLSNEVKFTAEMGKLYPVMQHLLMPGDIFKIGNMSVIRMLPMVAPVLHGINITGHIFAVPIRLLWNAETRELLEETGDWEDFITGGRDGDNADVLPRWEPTNTAKYSLWDHFGFPVDVDPEGAYPTDFLRRAYNLVWNEYYRHAILQDEVSLTNESILTRNWTKDYFTSCLPDQQIGTAPAVPITGITSADWTAGVVGSTSNEQVFWPSVQASDQATMYYKSSSPQVPWDTGTKNALEQNVAHGHSVTIPEVNMDNNTVDLGVASPFSIADLRTVVQTQRWMERNARVGVRYFEVLRGHYGISPRDETLQRPEYVGGWRCPLIVSEVLQTSETNELNTPQGTMVGHGIGISDSFAGKYFAKEFCILIELLSIMPDPAYSQGINRQWLQQTKFDFPWPEFAHLSEQAVLNAEVCAIDGDEVHNADIFGYQGRYNEFRVTNSYVCSDMRDTFNYWHLSREFNPALPPQLNSDFLQCNPSRRIFADEEDPGFIVSCGNLVKAIRPIPASSEPGLMDHV